MTREQWLALKPGDTIIDTACGHRERVVLTVRRTSGKPGQQGKTRTVVTLASLVPYRRPITVFNSDDTRGKRFIYPMTNLFQCMRKG